MNFFISIFNKQCTYKNFVQASIIAILIIANCIALLNYYIDPLRLFQHKNSLNEKQLDFNERQQKTNYLKFVAMPQQLNFESILLGSSRTTYINQNAFQQLYVYNYAANNMSPYEYKKFIAYFTEITGKEPKNIILGVDFFGTAIEKNKGYSHENFLAQTKSTTRWQILYNFNLAMHSLKNIKQRIKSTKPYYDRDNKKFAPQTHNYQPKTTEEIEKKLFTYQHYEFDSELKHYYNSLKNQYRNSRFIIYTTPITINQLKNYKKNNYLQYYFRWLRELVEVFGEVHHFMYPNAITKDLNNFFDPTHMMPFVGDKIARYISEGQKFEDFGITLTKDNIEKFIQEYPTND